MTVSGVAVLHRERRETQLDLTVCNGLYDPERMQSHDISRPTNGFRRNSVERPQTCRIKTHQTRVCSHC